jgi:rhodanese-related sulfurtransferase
MKNKKLARLLTLLVTASNTLVAAAVQADEAIQDTNKAPFIVDVRTPPEFAAGHYPGAVNIPLNEIFERLGEFGHKDRKIIVYCRSGSRSAFAKRILEQSKFSNVTNGGSLVNMMATTSKLSPKTAAN